MHDEPLLSNEAWASLRKWYKVHGRHSLPWRSSRTPWKIFLAETLLRRTNAAVASTVFSDIVRRFTSPNAVVQNESDWRKSIWSLGIHQRADLFVEACRTCIERHGNSIPSDVEDLRALPGVGHYAASAVRCFGFEIPETIVDTNTIRIARRVSGSDISQASHRSNTVQLTVRRLSPDDSGLMPDDNFALLDLAAMVCSSAHPNCSVCPLRFECTTGKGNLGLEDMDTPTE